MPYTVAYPRRGDLADIPASDIDVDGIAEL
jgi:hypothetical protein